MSTPTMTPFEQNETLGEMTKILLGVTPLGWQRLIFDYMVIGRKAGVGMGVRMTDGSTQQVRVPRELAPLVSELRQGMYAHGVGTWYSMRLIVDVPDRYSAKYNWNERPPFGDLPGPEQFALDQERFPRTPENMPEWFRQGLNGT